MEYSTAIEEACAQIMRELPEAQVRAYLAARGVDFRAEGLVDLPSLRARAASTAAELRGTAQQVYMALHHVQIAEMLGQLPAGSAAAAAAAGPLTDKKKFCKKVFNIQINITSLNKI